MLKTPPHYNFSTSCTCLRPLPILISGEVWKLNRGGGYKLKFLLSSSIYSKPTDVGHSRNKYYYWNFSGIKEDSLGIFLLEKDLLQLPIEHGRSLLQNVFEKHET